MTSGRPALALLAALCGASVGSEASAKIVGAEAPDETRKSVRKDVAGSREGEHSTQSCYLYGAFAVIEVDSGQKGAERLLLRPRSKGSRLDVLCGAAPVKGEIRLADNEQYFEGAVQGFLVTKSADGFGDLATVWIYDARSGRLLHEAPYSLAHDLVLEPTKGSLALSYYRAFDAKSGPPAGVTLDAPACAKAGTPETQAFARVRVDDVRGGEAKALPGAAHCAPVP